MNLGILFVNSLKQSWEKLVRWELALLLILVLLKLIVPHLHLEKKENVKINSYAKKISAFDFEKRNNKVNRPGIHAKTKHSNHKNSKNYRKLNRGQGR